MNTFISGFFGRVHTVDHGDFFVCPVSVPGMTNILQLLRSPLYLTPNPPPCLWFKFKIFVLKLHLI